MQLSIERYDQECTPFDDQIAWDTNNLLFVWEVYFHDNRIDRIEQEVLLPRIIPTGGPTENVVCSVSISWCRGPSTPPACQA